MKQVEVQIMGQGYLLGCPEGGESRLLEAVERVDTAMCKIRDGGKIKARDRIAVLAALNLAFDLSDRAAAGAAPSVTRPTTKIARSGAVDGDTQVAALISRLDAALGEDGRLL